MVKSPEHRQLMKVLNKMTVQERWQRMPKKKGKVAKSSLTKSGNLKLVLENGTVVYVLKRNKNLFQEASLVKKGEIISVTARRYLGKFYCTRLAKKSKESRPLREWLEEQPEERPEERPGKQD